MVLLVLSLVAAGCTDTVKPHHGTARSGLGDAMAAVRVSEPTTTYFAYSDLKALRRIGAITEKRPSDRRWGDGEVGLGDFGSRAILLQQAIGLNVLGADTAVSVGSPPDSATVLTGTTPVATITAKLTALGVKPRTFGSTDGWSAAPDNKVDVTGRFYQQTRMITQANQMVVDAHRFAASPNGETLQEVLGGGSSPLSEADSMPAMIDCLGPVVAAVVYRPTGASSPVDRIGVGVTLPGRASGPQREILCVLPAPGKHDPVRARVKTTMTGDAADPVTRSPISSYLTGVAIDDLGIMVRVTGTDPGDRPAGYLLRSIYTRTVEYFVGASTRPR